MLPIDCTSIEFADFKIPSINKDNQDIIFKNCLNIPSISPPTYSITVTGGINVRSNTFIYTILIGDDTSFTFSQCYIIPNRKCNVSVVPIVFSTKNTIGAAPNLTKGDIPGTNLLS